MPIVIQRRQDPEACRSLLSELPDWFGIPESNESYVEAARTLPCYVALRQGVTRGLALVERHFPQSAELHLIAVHPEEHGHGIGTALLDAIEDDLRTEDVKFLHVKTVGPSYHHAGYASTRQFYRVAGFIPLEERTDLGWDGPTLVLVKAL